MGAVTHRPRTLALAITLALAAASPAIAADRVSEPFPGVRILERTAAGPNRIFVTTTELCTSGVRVDARSSQATRIIAKTWGSAMGAQVAVNGDFFRGDQVVPTVYGDAVGVGMRWPTARSGLASAFAADWYFKRYGWIAFGPGWVEFMHTEYVKQHAAELGISEGYLGAGFATTIPEGTIALVSGFPELVVEGKVMSSFPERADCAARHPRTAMGLSEDRKTFILAVVDGRSAIARGMTCAELAPLMKELGAYTAFNLDGGGSSQMWVQGRGNINVPSDGAPRPVANLWGVFSSGDAAPTSCHQPALEPADAGPADAGDAPDASGDLGDAGERSGEGLGADGASMDGGCATGGGASSSLAAGLLLAVLAVARAAAACASQKGRR
jgi:hypothetical protein